VTGYLEGDPASCSLAGGSMRRLASQLRAGLADVQAAAHAVEPEWSGRVARTVGAQRRQVEEGVAAVADALDRAGAALQDYATQLADGLQAQRAAESGAAVAGLEVIEGQVSIAWGVAGVADEAAAQEREVRRDHYQDALDRAVVTLDRQRRRLVRTLASLTDELAAAAARLR
jgi:uncharacterized protein YukE